MKGRIPSDDPLHQVATTAEGETAPAPIWVSVPGVGNVPQYAPTVTGTSVAFDPATNCEGYFTSYKFQPHNNCYNYAANMATNTIAQPGRKHGIVLTGDINPDQVVSGAEADGLKLIGDATLAIDRLPAIGLGHFVALLIASADDTVGFIGDYHWVRCDDFQASCWSQKDGPDQVTNFDFAGHRIYDPSKANWKVNSGPFGTTLPGAPDFFVTYGFRAWMFVPNSGVDII